VLLIGARGAGKSTVGARLARLLDVPFVDADRRLEEETGRSVAALLAAGELRAREAELLGRLLAGGPAVVAAGGGAVLWEGLRRAARGWRVVWLDADSDVLSRRIRADGAEARPSLTGAPPHEEIAAVARERASLYAALAWRRVDSGRLKPDRLAAEIVKLLRAGRSPERPDAD